MEREGRIQNKDTITSYKEMELSICRDKTMKQMPGEEFIRLLRKKPQRARERHGQRGTLVPKA